MYSLVFYVPETHLESVKEAVFKSGAGSYQDYDHCCWQIPGQGQFRPLAGSNPFLGSKGKVEKVDEYRVETICQDSDIESVLKALVAAHPYEEPAYSYWLINPELP